ncbi:flagellar hook-length control protein FliK [Arthrobacter glacialis]|uniref:Flagellar hook-length control protein-like C-terminal domain-containing protein n=1 Tax=Arthrobacter glacialis TaxID=1664 RepID=A0A2S3ZXP4_ARTGL|nr:flagellar hook-length control protein FliK [Arthrobacter glacialis]POH73849.1 hypothetical protein CVS27_07980 [Arthrobacter glacialis]
MKMPATLFSSLSASPTTRAAMAPAATALTFGTRPGTAFGTALGAALGEAAASPVDGLSTEEPEDPSATAEPAEAADAALPDPAGPLAQAGPERTPLLDAAMTQFWAAAQIPATQQQLEAALVAAPQSPAPAASDGVSLTAAADGLVLVPVAAAGTGTLAVKRPVSGAASVAGPSQTEPGAAVPQSGGTPAAAVGGQPGNADAESAAVPGGVRAPGATPQPMAAVAPKSSADSLPARFNSAIAAPHLEGRSPVATTEPGRQLVDGAVAPAPSAPASSATSAIVPPAIPLPAQPPVPASMAPGGTQQLVPAGTPLLSEQLARPLFALAAAPLGEHVMTINVVPDALGPVTVRAHLAADGIRIEMMSPSDAGREGLRNILADLRRDLAAGGMTASLSMGSGNGNGSPDHGAGQRSPQGPGNPWSAVARPGDQDPPAQRRLAPSDIPSAANNSLDITV